MSPSPTDSENSWELAQRNRTFSDFGRFGVDEGGFAPAAAKTLNPHPVLDFGEAPGYCSAAKSPLGPARKRLGLGFFGPRHAVTRPLARRRCRRAGSPNPTRLPGVETNRGAVS